MFIFQLSFDLGENQAANRKITSAEAQRNIGTLATNNAMRENREAGRPVFQSVTTARHLFEANAEFMRENAKSGRWDRVDAGAMIFQQNKATYLKNGFTENRFLTLATEGLNEQQRREFFEIALKRGFSEDAIKRAQENPALSTQSKLQFHTALEIILRMVEANSRMLTASLDVGARKEYASARSDLVKEVGEENAKRLEGNVKEGEEPQVVALVASTMPLEEDGHAAPVTAAGSPLQRKKPSKST